MCPQGYTCCTSDMEDNLATLSRREMEGLLKNDGRSLQNALVGQHKTFDGECWRKERAESRSECCVFYTPAHVSAEVDFDFSSFAIIWNNLTVKWRIETHTPSQTQGTFIDPMDTP